MLVIATLVLATGGCTSRSAADRSADPTVVVSSSPAVTVNPRQVTVSPRRPKPTRSPVTPQPTLPPTPTEPPATSTFTPAATWNPSGPPIDAELLAMLPTSISGFPLQRYVMPARVLQGGGDVCSIVCPEEPRLHAEAFGIDLDELILGAAIPEWTRGGPAAGPQVFIVAWRAPGADAAGTSGRAPQAPG